MIKAQKDLKDKGIVCTELLEQMTHADQGPESNVQMIHALIRRRDAACAKLHELVGEESNGDSSPGSSPVQRRVRPGSASPDASWSAHGAQPSGSRRHGPKKNNGRPQTAEPRRSEDAQRKENSRSAKGRNADAGTRPQAQRKGLFSLLANSIYHALTRTKESKTELPETPTRAVSPETWSAELPESASPALSDEEEHIVPPTDTVRSKHRHTSKDARKEPPRLRQQEGQSRSMCETTSMREPIPKRHGARACEASHQSQSFTYGQKMYASKKKSPEELQEELWALFGAAKESGAVKEVDGYESPPPRSPSQSRVKKAGGEASTIAPFKASHQRISEEMHFASAAEVIRCELGEVDSNLKEHRRRSFEWSAANSFRHPGCYHSGES